MSKNNFKNFFKKTTLLFVLLIICSVSIVVNTLPNIESVSNTKSTQFCNSLIDKNGDNIPDEIVSKKNINWAFCNLSDTNFSKLTSFDYKESDRPFVGEFRYHTSKYAEPIGIGIPNDAHTFRQHGNLGLIDRYIELFYSFFGVDYDIDDKLYTGANFENANFTHANFRNTNLIDSKLRFGNFNSVDFSESELNGANFEHSDLNDANFKNANLQHSSFYRANLKNVNFEGADLSFAYFYEYENHETVSLRNFSNSILYETLMENATLSHANFNNAEINNTKFFFADLSDADFSKSKFISGNFSHANLSNSNLSNLNLSESHFVGANLSGANLSGANLSGANLSGANLSGTTLDKHLE